MEMVKITCYRHGGCGPYEMMSCSECPASKPEYLRRYPITMKFGDKEIVLEEPIIIPETLQKQYLGKWIELDGYET